MKKIILILITFCFLLCSCDRMSFESNSSYIQTVKKIQINSRSIEDILQCMFTELTTGSDVLIDKDAMKWEVEGKTKTGRVVVCSYKGIKVVIPTEIDGDYIEVNSNNAYYTIDGVEKKDINILLYRWDISNREYIDTLRKIKIDGKPIGKIVVFLFTELTTKYPDCDLINERDIKWEVKEVSNEGRTVTCTYKNIQVVIPSLLSKDNINVSPWDAYYTINGERQDDRETLSFEWEKDHLIREGTKEVLNGLGPDDEISTRPSTVYNGDSE